MSLIFKSSLLRLFLWMVILGSLRAQEAASTTLAPHAKSYQEALIAFKSNQWETARAAAEESNGLKPNDPKTLSLLGRIALAEKKLEAAHNYLSQAIAKAGTDTTPHLYMGDLLRMKKDFSMARASYQKHLDAHPKDPDALLKLVYCYLSAKDTDAATRTASALDAFNQLHPGYYFARAAIAETLGNKEQAGKLLGSAQTLYGETTYLSFLREYLQALKN